MSEARFEDVMRELRAAAPTAPEQLRDRVHALREPSTRHRFRLRPALVAAVAIAIAVGLGAAAIGAFRGSSSTPRGNADVLGPMLLGTNPKREFKAERSTSTIELPGFALTTSLPPGSRLQDYHVTMKARVEDLSGATKSAVRTTRKLGGYVAAANYATGQTSGDSRLDLRVPVQHVQQAIGSFTELGTILSQRISVDDLQRTVDLLDQRRSDARKLIAELEAKRRSVGLTPAEEAKLAGAKRTVARLSRSRTSLVSEGAYAKISLSLTTQKPAAKHVAPGRFDRFWGDAGDILGKEAIIVLYALVVAGPFALLAALGLLGERARRRRADSRLLGETG